jgi:Ca2+-binding RTX toxin-like protein
MSNVDRIADYSIADDTIWLDQSIFADLATGTLAEGAFRNGTAALDANDRILYDKASGNMYFDADGNGSGAAILFGQVDPGSALTHLDYFVTP